MKRLLSFVLVLIVILSGVVSVNATGYNTQMDDLSKVKLKEVFALLNKNKARTLSEKMDLVSASFLGVDYVANRLVGSNDVAEELVIDLYKLDCFTYLDYLESFRRSENEEQFIENLKKVRYIDSKVEYLKRKHFYSDWAHENEVLVSDLVKDLDSVSPIKAKDVVNINQGAKGEYIPNLGVRERDVYYISRDNVNDENLNFVITGDYVGFRREIAGLDVTHTGMLVKKNDGIYVRHASSSKSTRKVVDQKLTDYLNINTGVKGILILRSNVAQLRVDYVDEFGTKLKDSLVEIKKIGDNYEISVPDFEGFVVSKYEGDIKGVMTTTDVVVTIVYNYDRNLLKEDGIINNKTLPKTGVINE